MHGDFKVNSTCSVDLKIQFMMWGGGKERGRITWFEQIFCKEEGVLYFGTSIKVALELLTVLF